MLDVISDSPGVACPVMSVTMHSSRARVGVASYIGYTRPSRKGQRIVGQNIL